MDLTLSGKLALCNLIGRSTLLELAQGFELVTPDPFSLGELGGVLPLPSLSLFPLSPSPSPSPLSPLSLFPLSPHPLSSLTLSLFPLSPFPSFLPSPS